jgi:diguanylate cyclase (GGDEF)-like protein
VGDMAIKEVARILDEQLKDKKKIISRFGGEEFCIMLFELSEKETLELYENIRLAFENNVIKIGKHTISYTVSIGLHFVKDNSLIEAVNLSDERLYSAKESGRNKVVSGKE